MKLKFQHVQEKGRVLVMIQSLEVISLKSLQDKDSINDRAFLVKDKVKGIGKNGKSFLSLLVGDRTGHLDARLWDRVEDLSEVFGIGDIILIKGQVQVYQGRKQIIIHKLEKPDQSNYQIENFQIEEKKVDSHAVFSELLKIVDQIKSSYIKQLTLDCLQDQEIKDLLLKAAAAKTIHHAWPGGLLQHIVSMVKLAKLLATHYQNMNEDLLVFGAIFHDLGKIWELETERHQTQYTRKGRLLGHMQLSCELIDRKSLRILGFPDDLRDVLKHIVLSHHGKLEFGSPKRPKFLEAMVVAMIDELDSKIDTLSSFIQTERQTGDEWSRYSEHFDRYFLLEDLKDKWL